jgi:hypothetical protein
MERGLLAPLSPHEETALRRIAQGATEVPDIYSRRLIRLAPMRRFVRRGGACSKGPVPPRIRRVEPSKEARAVAS